MALMTYASYFIDIKLHKNLQLEVKNLNILRNYRTRFITVKVQANVKPILLRYKNNVIVYQGLRKGEDAMLLFITDLDRNLGWTLSIIIMGTQGNQGLNRLPLQRF